MLGKIADMNSTYAFIVFEDGTTIDLRRSELPSDKKVGDTVEVPLITDRITNDKLVDFF